MTKLEKVLYTARAHTTGGRDGGASRTDDGRPQVSGQYSHRILKSIGHNLPQKRRESLPRL